MPRALLSVHDKTGLIEFSSKLIEAGWDLVASGGTERALQAANLAVIPVEQLTNTPELLGGRVKTLHPAIHAGILARDNDTDFSELETAGFSSIDMVVCNLYPFQETVAKSNISLKDAIEQIDIGGVTLLRAAAKNFMRVIVVCDNGYYQSILDSLDNRGQVSINLRRDLAVKAFAHTKDYDTAIHTFLAKDKDNVSSLATEEDPLPENISIRATRVAALRYGENPHQLAAYYSKDIDTQPLGGTVLGGKALSYNNILDLDAAWRAVSSFSEPAVVIVKHLNPIGISIGANIAEAYTNALASDPVSAFGGVIAVNREVDEAFNAVLGSLFVEAIAAPSFSIEAQAQLNVKRKNCRLVQLPAAFDGKSYEIRSIHRGFLVQTVDLADPDGITFKTVTKRIPTTEEIEALNFAWKAVQHVKSNAIVITNRQSTLGIGGGLPSRLDATKLAIEKAGEKARGAVLASDAFFPFADGIEAAIQSGITAVIQPGGSVRDSEVIEVADAANIAMIFTGVRHFRH